MKITHEARCALISRIAAWCFDNTESWEEYNIGVGLAYLFWAISSPNRVEPFDATLENSGGAYAAFVRILERNPNGLLKDLVDGGFIVVDSKSVRRRIAAQKEKKKT